MTGVPCGAGSAYHSWAPPVLVRQQPYTLLMKTTALCIINEDNNNSPIQQQPYTLLMKTTALYIIYEDNSTMNY
ncbi:uncharacterized protein LOC127724876 [Mytilus californianus]|uniref:uncharacterized protein LOC127724876 n=1 Tax=Mytilus californianus TaxID=6549 RepID=UPI002245C767|nr:uncharacterized protein LOC127724876 [Mytilus californianus]